MVLAWMMDDSADDQRSEHHRSPKEFVSLDELARTTGVFYQKMDSKSYVEELDEIKKKRGYHYEDTVEICQDKLPNFEEKIKHFFQEHIHADEEIRFVLAGSGYFDVRNSKDEWVRILVEPMDLLILPAGIYHRFTLDTNNYIKANRLFVGEPVWTPHNRPGADEMAVRKEYVKWQKGIAA